MYDSLFFRGDGQLVLAKLYSKLGDAELARLRVREGSETDRVVTRNEVHANFQRLYFEFLAGELYRLLTKRIEPPDGATSRLFLNKGGRLVRSRAASPQEVEEEPSDPVKMEDVHQKDPMRYFQFVAGEMFTLLK